MTWYYIQWTEQKGSSSLYYILFNYNIQFIPMVYVFFRLIYLTRKLHNYEYNENKRSMILFFTAMSCFIAFSIFELLYIASLDSVSLAGGKDRSSETQL